MFSPFILSDMCFMYSGQTERNNVKQILRPAFVVKVFPRCAMANEIHLASRERVNGRFAQAYIDLALLHERLDQFVQSMCCQLGNEFHIVKLFFDIAHRLSCDYAYATYNGHMQFDSFWLFLRNVKKLIHLEEVY